MKLVTKLLPFLIGPFVFQTSCAARRGGFEALTGLDAAPGPRFSLTYSAAVFPKDYELAPKMAGPFLLEFFFEGCRCCRENHEAFYQVAEAVAPYASVFEVSIDCEEKTLRQWAEKTKPKWPVLSACDRDLADVLEVTRFPTTLVLDRERQVILRHVGIWSGEAREKILSSLRREAGLTAPSERQEGSP